MKLQIHILHIPVAVIDSRVFRAIRVNIAIDGSNYSRVLHKRNRNNEMTTEKLSRLEIETSSLTGAHISTMLSTVIWQYTFWMDDKLYYTHKQQT